MEETFALVKGPIRNSLFWRNILCVAVCLLISSGCSFLPRKKTVWQQPCYAEPNPDGIGNWSLAVAEESYAAAQHSEAAECPDCVDLYYQAATTSWPVMERELAKQGKTSVRSAELHRSAVAKLLVTAQRFGRWDPCRGVTVSTTCGKTHLPTTYQGFTWGPEEFRQLEPAGNYASPNISRAFRNGGLGVPLVVVRETAYRQPFTQKERIFSATAVLRPNDSQSGYQLEFHDPLRENTTVVAGTQVPLANDITAPFVFATQGENRQWLNGFLLPGRADDRDGLFMIEPFQPGKIPVVFIHGLLSDPATWVDVINELRAKPELNEHYQWWAFRYATGEPFLTSAARLRRQMTELRQTYDPTHCDTALSQTVLVGHSLGGLVAKLQVTQSGDRLWRTVADRPLANVLTTPQTRRDLHDAFFFPPSNSVARVVYIGTPHEGSPLARRPIGRLGSALVDPSERSEMMHSQLVCDNPNLFSPELQKRFPTSIDLLEPTSPLLNATLALPYSPSVALHSIVGYGYHTCTGEPSDSVVPVHSARLQGVQSEKDVQAKHEYLHRDPITIAEIARILRIHLRQNGLY
ncbi:Alpha/beta hydrolase family protein [Bythopirellula goksoeyrii]|uniref:Alpha/beta hydrolase family protein n=1 Tax=Bythopirellula goksoeyrii TaxID=1400387 RepID=A0A5B9QB30_9BACT|nr:Alpha/beta hydrolase family protein [Bythopirellula goksoeyrii]